MRLLRIDSLLIGLALIGAAGFAPAAEATRGGPPSPPYTATYAYAVGNFTAAQRDSLSWYDLVVCRERPAVVADMRARNPHQRLFHIFMPQSIVSNNDDETFWFPDTAWSLDRLCQFYAQQNDWYLYDIYGEKIEQWGCWTANWTPYCPLGVYGSSQGMTYAEWYIEVALPQIAFHSLGAWGEPWGWGSSAYDGIAWETFYECPACCEVDQYRYADPDRDGVAEGIEGTCFDGGDDSLEDLYHEVNEDFFARLQQVLPADFVINTNRGGVNLNPAWAWEMNGLKLEDWRPSHSNPVKSWWGWMYGRRGYGGAFVGDGYEFAERIMHRSGSDELDGWDMSWLMVWTRGATWTPTYRAKMQRFGMGTTLLGDGYFIFTEDQHYPAWFDALDWDFGPPVEGFQKELAGSDTLYVRRFEKGFVEVNPYAYTLRGIAYDDARFSFWLTVEDLAVESVDGTDVMLTWIVPEGEVNTIESTAARYAAFPITPENWASATPAPTGPIQGSPGERVYYPVRELEPETTYHFAVRNTVRGRVEPLISNVVSASTDPGGPPPPPGDTTPPAAIADLASPARGQSWIDLAWSAPGDDGSVGTADRYELRFRAGTAIVTETAWNQATPAGGLPVPVPAGGIQTFRLSGLSAGTAYGIAIRAFDEADHRADLSNPFVAATSSPPPPPPPPPEEDTTPPAAIDDLALLEAGETWARLRWSSPGDDGSQGRADHFVLGRLAGRPIDSEARWVEADTLTEGLPAPLDAGEPVEYTLTGLEPSGVYGVAVRAVDDEGLRSPLGEGILVTTLAPPPPDTIPPAPIADLRSPAQGAGWIDLAWSAPGEDGDQGVATLYRLRFRPGGAIASEADWESADSAAAPLPAPAAPGTPQAFRLEGLAASTLYGIALRAEDEAGNLAGLSNALTALTAPPPDTLAPAAIEDLRVDAATVGGFDLSWTAPGDDGAQGAASAYVLGWLAGEPIAGEAQWAAAERETLEVPLPAEAGTPQGCELRGLAPGALYGLALRALDDEGQAGALPAVPVTARTLEAADHTPPGHIQDLALREAGETTLDLVWTAPGDDGDSGRATSFALALAAGSQPIDSEERWQAAQILTAGLPAPPEAGEEVAYRLAGLAPGTDYGIAVRAFDEGGLAGALSNPLVAATQPLMPPPPPPPPADTQPPAAIEGLAALETGIDWADLEWHSPGDDSLTGRAARFVLGWRALGPLSSEADWILADTTAAGLPEPGDPGSVVAYRLAGLPPSSAISVAVRAYDDAGHRSPLGAALGLQTLAPPDTIPPARVTDLAATLGAGGAIRLRWTASGDDGSSGRAAGLIVARRADQMIESEEDWLAARRDTLEAGAAGGEPDTLSIAGLAPETAWGFALRYIDDAGLLGEVSNFVALSIPGAPAPGDTIPPAALEDLRVFELGENWVALSWSPVGDDGREGEAAGYLVAVIAGERAGAHNWDSAPHTTLTFAQGLRGEIEHWVGGLAPGESYGIAVRAYDEAGNLAECGEGVWVPQLGAGQIFAPAAVTDLSGVAGADGVELRWTSPASGRAGRPSDRVEIALARSSLGAANWEEADTLIVLDDPLPAGEPETLRVEGLSPETRHWIALRSDNGLGYGSALSNLLELETGALDRVAPGAPEAPLVSLTDGGAWVELSWAAVGAEDLHGYHIYGRSSRMQAAQRLTSEPIAATTWGFARPPAADDFFVSVTAVDASGNEGEPSEEVSLFRTGLDLAGPFPHPIEGEARFELTLPLDPAGELPVRAEIYSVSGLRVRRWVDETMPAGLAATLWWDTRTDGGESVAPGLYFLRLTAGEQALTRKIYVSR